MRFPSSANTIQLKVGISFISSLKARENVWNEIPHWSFEDTRQALLAQWENLLQRIDIASNTPEKYKRMFYTGIYHTMLMPVDRTGEIHYGVIRNLIMMIFMLFGTPTAPQLHLSH